MMLSSRASGFASTSYCCTQHTRRQRQQRATARSAGLLGFGGSKTDKITEAKSELLAAIAGVNRGFSATQDDIAKIDTLASKLEKLNPNKKSLAADEINGKWELLYTTSQSILGQKRPFFLRPLGPIYQYIDAPKLKARNNESWPYFNAVTASLTPESQSRVAVKFEQFKIFNAIPVTAPDSARGWLDTTFVDEELRVSRGDKGNLFVLEQVDPDARL